MENSKTHTQWYTGEFVEWLLDMFNSAEEESCNLAKRRYEPYTLRQLLDAYYKVKQESATYTNQDSK